MSYEQLPLADAFEFVAHGPGAWGRGGTMAEAITNMRKSLTGGTQSERKRNQTEWPCYVYASDKPIEVEIRDGGLRVRPQKSARFLKFTCPSIMARTSAAKCEQEIRQLMAAQGIN